jgi:single-strand DNA-binding protein
MNIVILVGRLTKDPELRFTPSTGKAVAKFSMAVDRDFSKEKATDFFNVTVFNKAAENVANFLKKGSMVAVKGSIQINSYTDNNGQKKYSTDILAERVQFLSGKSEQSGSTQKNTNSDEYDFSDFQSIDDDDIPF